MPAKHVHKLFIEADNTICKVKMVIIVEGRPHRYAFPGGRWAGRTGGPHQDMFPGVRYAHGRGGTPPGYVPGGTQGKINYLFIGTLTVVCCMKLAYIFLSTGDKK